MTEMTFGKAIDAALERAMSEDETIVAIGEDLPMLRRPLFARFGSERVLGAPISESSFLGAATGAAMAGLRPFVELYMVDFSAVAFDAILNHMAKLEAFSGGHWRCPLVVRAPCGGGYGDGGQHSQALWGILASIPGLVVIVPSTPSDAYGLTLAALKHDGPVILLEPKLLSEEWLEFLGSGGRQTVSYDVPRAGARGDVDEQMSPLRIGNAAVRRHGKDVTIVSLAVGVHRALAAAEQLTSEGVDCEVIDLRGLRPLDVSCVVESLSKTKSLVVVDEDYREYGLSGELAAVALEHGLNPKFARVCVNATLPYAVHLEREALPNVSRICNAVRTSR